MLSVSVLMMGLLSGCRTTADVNSAENELQLYADNEGSYAILQHLVSEFNATHPKTVVKIIPPVAAAELETQLIKGEVPDIMAIAGDSQFKEMQDAGVFAELTDKAYVQYIKEPYLRAAVMNHDEAEKVYGIPYTVSPSGIDVMLAAADGGAHQAVAEEFIGYMLEIENAQMYIDDQLTFSAVKGVEQTNPLVVEAMADSEYNKVTKLINTPVTW